MRLCKHYIVTGTVQGVFFRHNTKKQAELLGLTGWVRNNDDGSVELVACGHELKLEDFEKWLAKGPVTATVDNLEIKQWDDHAAGYDEFSIYR